QRTFSPPDKTLGFFIASSPENSILPKKLLKNVSVCSSGEYCLNQSTKLFSLPSKNSALSFGKYACEVVTPQCTSPSSGSILPIQISNNVVLAKSSLPTKATLSSLSIIKLTLSNIFCPLIVFETLATRNKSLPISRSGLNAIYG